jgi:adenine-specific DNA methylase
MPLVRQWWLAKRKGRRIALKPVVDTAETVVGFEVVRGEEIGFDPSEGTIRRGTVTCLFCGQATDTGYLQHEGKAGRLGHMPLAVICEAEGAGRDYRLFTSRDEARFRQATTLVSAVEDELPDGSISNEQPRIIWVILYGIDKWRHLFDERQSVALATFGRKVRAVYDQLVNSTSDAEYARAVVTYLAMALDRLANQGANVARWNNARETIEGVFARQAIPLMWDYAEINPFSDSTGNWMGALAWVTRVIEHTALASASPATVHQGTATRLQYSDGSFDAIVTDPPYYDAIPYSHLSDFFYVWLKRTLGNLYPDIFHTPLTPKGPEIVEQRPHRSLKTRKDKGFYERELTKAFEEAHRVLRPNGIFTVVFAHKSTSAWETLLNSLLEAGLVVTASWPLHTERPGRPIAQGSAALASSIFIVCRVRAAAEEGYFDDVRQELAAVIRERLDFFWEQGIRGADFFISAIGPAVSVFGRYARVHRLDGSRVGVDALLDLVQQLVSEYALDRILNGGAGRVDHVDAPTRYYILHRWAYQRNKVPFDDAMRLAMALGADVSELMERRGLLRQSGETVELLGPRERKGVRNLGRPGRDAMAAPVIDVLHRAAVLWESGDREALAGFLAANARGREDHVRLVAQTLVNVLPDEDGERRLLEGFLAGRDVLPEVVRQERLL